MVIPQVKAAGADVVIVSCHSGADTSSSYGDALPWPENASTLLAQQVPGIDAILVGHAHVEIPQRFVTNTATGKQVLLSEPLYWGMRLDRHGPRPGQGARPMGRRRRRARRHAAQRQHRRRGRRDRRAGPSPRTTRCGAYVNSVIGTSTQAMSRRDLAVRGHRRDRLHQLRPGRRGEDRRWPARPTRPCRSCRSRRRSTRPRRSRPATSPSATWPGSTSTTTPCSPSSSPAPR